MRHPLLIAFLILGGGLAVLLLSGDGGTIAGLTDYEFARIVGLLALLIFIGSGLFYRGAMSGALRNIAIWLALLLLLIAGYQYRYEVQDVLNRVTAGLVPGSPISITDASGRAAVILDIRSHGHFEARGEVDGTPVNFLVDTGATRTVMTADDARRAGIDMDSLSFNIPVATANGTTTAASTRAGSIAIGTIVRRNQPVLVASEGALGQSLLGMSFISTLSGFEMRGERLTLHD